MKDQATPLWLDYFSPIQAHSLQFNLQLSVEHDLKGWHQASFHAWKLLQGWKRVCYLTSLTFANHQAQTLSVFSWQTPLQPPIYPLLLGPHRFSPSWVISRYELSPQLPTQLSRGTHGICGDWGGEGTSLEGLWRRRRGKGKAQEVPQGLLRPATLSSPGFYHVQCLCTGQEGGIRTVSTPNEYVI